MIKKKSKKPKGPIEIDLSGESGNAYVLLGYAKNFSKQLGFVEERQKEILAEMMSGDYENLLKVFDREFGEFVILYR